MHFILYFKSEITWNLMKFLLDVLPICCSNNVSKIRSGQALDVYFCYWNMFNGVSHIIRMPAYKKLQWDGRCITFLSKCRTVHTTISYYCLNCATFTQASDTSSRSLKLLAIPGSSYTSLIFILLAHYMQETDILVMSV